MRTLRQQQAGVQVPGLGEFQVRGTEVLRLRRGGGLGQGCFDEGGGLADRFEALTRRGDRPVGRVTPAADTTINITNSSGGTCTASGGPIRCLRVTITAGGQIRMCDPAATTGTAAACS